MSALNVFFFLPKIYAWKSTERMFNFSPQTELALSTFCQISWQSVKLCKCLVRTLIWTFKEHNLPILVWIMIYYQLQCPVVHSLPMFNQTCHRGNFLVNAIIMIVISIISHITVKLNSLLASWTRGSPRAVTGWPTAGGSATSDHDDRDTMIMMTIITITMMIMMMIMIMTGWLTAGRSSTNDRHHQLQH